MELYQRIEETLRKSIREKNDTAKDALRMLLTSLKLKEKEMRRQPSETEIHQVIASLVKQRRDSIEQFKAGGACGPRRERRKRNPGPPGFHAATTLIRRTGTIGRRSCF